jgi:hypothetical protein
MFLTTILVGHAGKVPFSSLMILMVLNYRLPHGLNISASFFGVPPITEGRELEAYIEHQREALLKSEQADLN